MADVKIIDHSDEVLKAFDEAEDAALEAMGNQGVTYAKQNITQAGRVDTGALRNSISHAVVAKDKAVYIGTNMEYAIYNELGTGIYAEGGRGRKTPWMYQDAHGDWHRTRGMKPIHFLKRAATEHSEEYKAIANSKFRGK